MSLPTQRISPGNLQEAFQKESAHLAAAGGIAKIWSKQPDLWTRDPAHARIISDRLGWIGVLDTMRAAAPAIAEFARGTVAPRFRDIVLLGMGGSSLAPEVFSLTFPALSGRRFFVLDSTDPESITSLTATLDLEHTLFVAASKSGKTVETLSQYAYFREQLRAKGVSAPGEHFVAITDAGSHLDQLGTSDGFLRTFRNPEDIGGRYSALSFFGLVPAALWDVDIIAVLDAAAAMRAACGPDAPPAANPALQLGALLGAAAQAVRDKVVLLSTPRLVPLGNWIEQLIAESTGKESRGIVPVAGGATPPLEVLARGCVTVALGMQGEDDSALRKTVAALEQRGAPFATIQLAGPADLGAEFFCWEVAIALAGVALAIDPFDEPNVQESKDNTSRILGEFQKTNQMPLGASQLSESGIELYATGSLGSRVTGMNLAGALRALFSSARPNDYVALLAYVARDAADAAELDALRALLGERLEMPVLLGYGPRYMHSIGQLYKGGPPTGIFLVITSQKREDVPIPGAKYTFGQLQMAQALGDLQSLAKRDKPAMRVHLTQGVPAGLAALRRAFTDALADRQAAQ